MIRKPDAVMRRGFWRADAWAAARAEKGARWHTPNPDHPIASRIVVGMILLLALVNGLMVFVATFAILFVFIEAGALLRRVLMYWSIRRYGPWREMAPEMRAMLDNPSDLAQRPDRFTAMPKGFTSTADAPAPAPGPDYWRIALPFLFIGLCLLAATIID